jgi:hypothetical protein
MIFFDDEMGDDVIDYYKEIAASGSAQEALDVFMSDYILTFSARFSDFVKAQMIKATDIINPTEFGKISMSVSSATVAFKEAQKKVYTDFINKVYGDAATLELNVTNPAVIEAIKNNTVITFNSLIDGALQGTHVDVIDTIRNYQYDLIEGSNKITTAEKFLNFGTDEIQSMKDQLNSDLASDHSDFFSMSEDGNFVRYSDGKLVNFDDYNEMATRTTTLNVQRDAVEMQQALDGERISEYVILDDRPLKTDKKGRTHPREICQEIMGNKWNGAALIAHDDDAAETFGIYTIDEAKELGAMGPNCRHGIQPLSEDLSIEVENILYFPEESIA